jgi:hypothetical protein
MYARAHEVACDVYAVFEHMEPRSDVLPSWLDLDVPDDRCIASSLPVQPRPPMLEAVRATKDINLQDQFGRRRQ